MNWKRCLDSIKYAIKMHHHFSGHHHRNDCVWKKQNVCTCRVCWQKCACKEKKISDISQRMQTIRKIQAKVRGKIDERTKMTLSFHYIELNIEIYYANDGWQDCLARNSQFGCNGSKVQSRIFQYWSGIMVLKIQYSKLFIILYKRGIVCDILSSQITRFTFKLIVFHICVFQ